MDELPLVVGTALATKVVEMLAEAGRDWFRQYRAKALPRVAEKAKGNQDKFMALLTPQLVQLATDLRRDADVRLRVEANLGEPDVALTLKSILEASWRTDNPEKHSLLARLVSERLAANSDSLISLAIPLACSAVVTATPRQIGALGTATLMYEVRPASEPKPEALRDFWERCLPTLLPLEAPTYLDLKHLEALSCIHLRDIPAPMKKVMSDWEGTVVEWSFDEFAASTVGAETKRLWDSGMSRIQLTTVGVLIGTYVIDHRTGVPTLITW